MKQGLKNNFFSSYSYGLYQHYVDSINNRGVFYGERSGSSIEFIFNPNPSMVKNFQTINYEGTNGWQVDYFLSDANRFIPQIYFENEYIKVKELGFNNVIFTLYRIADYSNDQIFKIIKKMDLYAITMDPARLRSGIVKKIDKNDFFVYVHTVNSLIRFIQYKLFFGADEIYTDNLF